MNYQLYFGEIPLPQAPAGQVWGVRCYPTGKMEPRQCQPCDLIHYTNAVDKLRQGYTAMVWLDEYGYVENILANTRGIVI